MNTKMPAVTIASRICGSSVLAMARIGVAPRSTAACSSRQSNLSSDAYSVSAANGKYRYTKTMYTPGLSYRNSRIGSSVRPSALSIELIAPLSPRIATHA